MGNYKTTLGNYKPEGGGQWTKLGETELSSEGTSLKITGLSIQMDPSVDDTYIKLIAYYNLIGDVNKVITATISAQTGFTGNSFKVESGTRTDATYSNTATIPLAAGKTSTIAGEGTFTIGCGERATNEKSIRYGWVYNCETDLTSGGGGYIRTTATTIFTEIDIISSANMDAGSVIALYGVKR